MKRNAFIAAGIALVISGATYAAEAKHEHGHGHKPLHGGVVVEVKDVDYELVAAPALIRLHLRDHGKEVDMSRTTAKLTLLTGTDRQEVDLKPSGGWLQAAGSFKVASGTRVVAVVMTPGKPPATVRFVLK